MGFHLLSDNAVAEDMTRQIRAMIASGALRPGDRLPSERDVAEQLGIGHSLARKALSLLERKGLVTGASAGEVSLTAAWESEISEEQHDSPDEDSVSDMYEVRKIIEPAAARLAAGNATAEELARIKESLRQMELTLTANGPDKGVVHDAAFHRAIAEASHNAYLSRIIHMLTGVFRASVAAGRKHLYSERGGAEKLMEQHRAIYEAIARRQRTAAEQAVLVHLTYAQKKKHWS